MGWLDELHLNYLFAGSRMLCALLRRANIVIARRHVRTLRKRMGIAAIDRRPNELAGEVVTYVMNEQEAA